jgi:hypothetical protein
MRVVRRQRIGSRFDEVIEFELQDLREDRETALFQSLMSTERRRERDEKTYLCVHYVVARFVEMLSVLIATLTVPIEIGTTTVLQTVTFSS